MNNKVLLIIAAVVVVGAVAWSLNRSDDSKMKGEGTAIDQEKDKKAMDEKKDEGAMMEKSDSYKDYSVATVASEQSAGKKVVLFFYAPWCPYCRAADAVFKANGGEIPAGVTVLKTDYDSEKELKAKYGVTYQHTFVEIDNNGNQVAKWVSGDTAALKANLK